MAYVDQPRGSVMSAALWMIGLSIVLFWLPTVGPLIAGFVGGRKAGSVGNALLAAVLPALILVVIVVVGGTIVGLPIVGVLAGAGLFIALVVHIFPLLIGAVVGALL